MDITLDTRERRLLFLALSKLMGDDETLAYFCSEAGEGPIRKVIAELKALRAKVGP